MASSPTALAPQKPLEDPLAHLPCSSIVEYRKGQMIYNQDQPSTSIYLVIDGKVKGSRLRNRLKIRWPTCRARASSSTAKAR
jgi:CRP/FNR family cyclic AMP-dependent transcriptional regulator